MTWHCLVEVEPYDPIADARVPLRLASAEIREITGLGGVAWAPALAEAPRTAMTLFDGGFGDAVKPGGARLPIVLARAREHFAIVDRVFWPGAAVKIYIGRAGDAWPWTLHFAGKVASFQTQDGTLGLGCEVDDSVFQVDVLTATFAGTGDEEGGADLKGKPKPLVIGHAKNVEPVLIDPANSVYQFSAYGAIEAVDALFERASDFGAATGDYADYDALVAASIPPGRWATCLAQGMVRLGAPAFGLITGDVRGHRMGGSTPRLTGAVIQTLAGIAGVDSGRLASATLDAMDSAAPYPINVVVTEQTRWIDLARRLALPCNHQAGISLTGQFFVTRVAFGASTAGQPRVEVADVTELAVSPPYARTMLGANRAWRVHTADEIAFEAPLVPRGLYDAGETYRLGNIVSLADRSEWLYINDTPGSGHAPPAWPTTSNSWWSNMVPPALQLTPRGAYSGTTSYSPGDIVLWAVADGGDGNTYGRIGTGDTTGVDPSDGSKWAIFVAAGAQGPAGADGVDGAPGVDGEDALAFVGEPWVPGKIGGSGDFVFNLNYGFEGYNPGEINILASRFYHPDGTLRTTGLQGTVLTAYGEGTAGRFYLVYSQASKATRFSTLGGTAQQGNAVNVFLARPKTGGGWEAINNNGAVEAFTPLATDCILAVVEAETTSSGLTAISPFVSGAVGLDGEPGTDGLDGVDGIDGTDGKLIEFVWKRAPTQPSAPTGNGIPSGWSDDPPPGSDPLWMSKAKQELNGVLVSGESWSTPIRHNGPQGPQGDPGADGLSIAELTVFKRAASAPATPSGGSYNFASKTLTPPSGWMVSIPSGSEPLYAARGTAFVVGASGAATPSWLGVGKLAENGVNGTNGANGADGDGVDVVFRRSTTQPATPSPSTGTPASWYTDVGSVPAGAGTIWSSFGQRPNSTSNYTWGTPVRIEGVDGADGVSPYHAQLSLYTKVVEATSANGTKAGQVPFYSTLTVKKGDTSILGSCTVTLAPSSGAIIASYSAGVITVTQANVAGYIDVEVKYAGATIATLRIDIGRLQDPAPPQSVSSLSAVLSGLPVAGSTLSKTGPTVTLAANPSGALVCTFGGAHVTGYYETPPNVSTFNMNGAFVYRSPPGSGSWNFTTQVAGGTSSFPPGFPPSPGAMNMGPTTISGLTAGAYYEVGVAFRQAGGTSGAVSSVGGNLTVSQ